MKKQVKKKQPKNKITFDMLLSEIKSMKIKYYQSVMKLEEKVKKAENDVVTLSRSVGSLLDLVSDITNIPKKVMTERFIFYNQERHMINAEGKVKGEIKITGYGFC